MPTTRELTAAINARDWIDEQASLALSRMQRDYRPSILDRPREDICLRPGIPGDFTELDDETSDHYRAKWEQDR